MFNPEVWELVKSALNKDTKPSLALFGIVPVIPELLTTPNTAFTSGNSLFAKPPNKTVAESVPASLSNLLG